MDSSHAQNPIISALAQTVQLKLPQSYELLRVLDQTALFTDVDLIDRESDRRYFARIYRAPESMLDQVFELWNKHAGNLTSMRHPDLLPSRGLVRLGTLAVHLCDYRPLLDLANYQSQVGVCGAEYAIRLVIQLLRMSENALAGDWSQQNLHPRDIGLLQDGSLVLRHFGLFAFERELAEALELWELWDPTFLSLEHLQGERIQAASLTYQIGALLHTLVVGQPPFVGNYESIREGHLKKALSNPQAANRAIQTGLARVLLKALAKNTHERFDNCGDFVQTLAMLLPLHERADFATHLGPVYVRLSEKERERLAEQTQQAAEQYGAQAYDEALHTVGAVLLIAYDHPQARELGREIWLERHRLTLETTWEQALELEREGDESQSLACIQRFLSLAPDNEEALGLQAELLGLLATRDSDLHQRIPIQATMERANIAETLDERWLAEGLWFQVLFSGALPGESFTDLLRMQKHLAHQGLEHHYPELFPQEHASPEVETAGEDFELDLVFERLVPPAAPPHGEGEEAPLALNEPVPEPEVRTPSHLDTQPLEIRKRQDPANETLRMPRNAMPAHATQPEAEPASAMPQIPELPEIPEPTLLPHAVELPLVAPLKSNEPPSPPLDPEGETGLERPKSGKKWLLAVMVLILVAAAGFVIFRQKQHQEALELAVAKVEALENAGTWPEALLAWREAAKAFPKETLFAERANQLETKIHAREKAISDAVSQGRRMLSQGILVGNGNNNVGAYLHSAEAQQSDHPLVEAFRDEIRSSEMARARSLMREQLLAAAKSNYEQLVSISESFRNPDFERELQQSLREVVLEPGLKSLESALKKRQLERAFELSDDLRAQLGDVPELEQVFAPLNDETKAKLVTAREKQRKDQELAALELLVRIQPNDSALVAERDLLSRELNEARIQDAESRIAKGMGSENWLAAGRAAAELTKIDSGNALAKESLARIQAQVNKQVNELKRNNLRAAFQYYEPYALVFNARAVRKEIDEMRSRIAAFDAEAVAVQRLTSKALDEQLQAIIRVLERYSDFAGDPMADPLRQLRTDLESEGKALSNLLEWESEASTNPKLSYQSILEQLQAAGPFKTTSARERVAQLQASYQRKIENYQGEATITIVGAKGVPKSRGLFPGLPDPSCQIKAGGQTLRTPIIKNNQNPTWNFQCKLKADGKPLEFSLMNDSKGKSVGAIVLDRFPASGRLELTANEGWQLILEVKRAR